LSQQRGEVGCTPEEEPKQNGPVPNLKVVAGEYCSLGGAKTRGIQAPGKNCGTVSQTLVVIPRTEVRRGGDWFVEETIKLHDD